MNKKLMQGTFWLTFANLLCKVLGVVYLIPWLSMMVCLLRHYTMLAIFHMDCS